MKDCSGRLGAVLAIAPKHAIQRVVPEYVRRLDQLPGRAGGRSASVTAECLSMASAIAKTSGYSTVKGS